ncbi:MAG: fimbrillin family protein [Bacteroidales bacterium]
MKRNFLHLSLLIGGLTFASCTSTILDSTHVVEPDELIDFGLKWTEHTRGAQLTNDALTSMGVFASKNLGDYDPTTSKNEFMYNQLVEKKNNVWTYSPVKQWPVIEGVSFFAYAPYMNDADMLAFSPQSEPGYPQFTYTMPVNIADQIDLLVAQPKCDQYYYKSPTVDFSFSHQLACIDFSASLAANFPVGGDMKITQIIVAGLNTKGTLAVPPLPATDYVWTLDESQKAEFTFSTANGLLDNRMLSKVPQQLTNSVNKFMPIPQTISAQGRMIVRTEYTKGGITKAIAFENAIALSKLLPGKRYVINLELNVTEIQVDYVVNDWVVNNIEIPPFN